MRGFSRLIIFYSLCSFKLFSQDYNLISNNVNTFISEHNHQLWIASTSQGYNQFNGIETNHYILNDSISGLDGTYVQSLLLSDSKGQLWTTTYERLCFLDEKYNRFDCRSIIVGKDTFAIGYHLFHLDKQDKIWMRAEDQILLFNAEINEVDQVIGKTQANSFAWNNDTLIGAPWMNEKGFEIWINQDDEWEVQRQVLVNCPTFKDIQVIKALWVNNELWLLTQLGLVLYDFNSPCNSKTYKSLSLDVEAYNCFHQNDSFIFLGTNLNEILVFDLRQLEFINPIRTKWNDVDHIFSSVTNDLIYSDYKYGVSVIPNAFIDSEYELINDLNFDWIKIIRKQESFYLLNAQKELYRFHEKKLSRISKNVNDFDFMGDDLLIGMGKYDFFAIDLSSDSRSKITHSWTQGQSLRTGDDAIFLKADNSLYIYYPKGNLSFKEVVSEKHKKKIQAIGTPHISDLPYAYDGRNLWFVRNGIEVNHEVENYITDLVYDPNSAQLFVGTNTNLVSLHFNDQKNKIEENEIAKGEEYNSLVLYRNELFFSTKSRVGRYNINKDEYRLARLSYEQTRPTFHIGGDSIYVASNILASYSIEEFFKESRGDLKLNYFKVNNENLELNKIQEINLSHDENLISWSASIDYWAYANLASIEYQLLPDQEEWATVENHSEVQLPKLLPNNYTLNLRGVYSTANVSDVKSIGINISPAWQDTLLAKIFFIGLTGLFFYGLYRNRIRKLTAQNKIQEEIRQLEKSALQAQMNPHFIFNCLNSIQSFIMDNDKENAMDYLGRFAQLIRSNLNASVESYISLFEEIRILENYLKLEQLRLDGRFSFAITCDSGIDEQDVSIPPMLIQPFVENAVIHGMAGITENGLIKVNFSRIENRLLVSIEDNGNPKEQDARPATHKSLGVNITKQRLEHINRRDMDQVGVTIDHRSQGTLVSLSIEL